MKTRLDSVLTTTCFASCSWFSVQPEVVNAVSVTFNQRTNDAYLYTVELDSGESLAEIEYYGSGIVFMQLYYTRDRASWNFSWL